MPAGLDGVLDAAAWAELRACCDEYAAAAEAADLAYHRASPLCLLWTLGLYCLMFPCRRQLERRLKRAREALDRALVARVAPLAAPGTTVRQQTIRTGAERRCVGLGVLTFGICRCFVPRWAAGREGDRSAVRPRASPPPPVACAVTRGCGELHCGRALRLPWHASAGRPSRPERSRSATRL